MKRREDILKGVANSAFLSEDAKSNLFHKFAENIYKDKFENNEQIEYFAKLNISDKSKVVCILSKWKENQVIFNFIDAINDPYEKGLMASILFKTSKSEKIFSLIDAKKLKKQTLENIKNDENGILSSKALEMFTLISEKTDNEGLGIILDSLEPKYSEDKYNPLGKVISKKKGRKLLLRFLPKLFKYKPKENKHFNRTSFRCILTNCDKMVKESPFYDSSDKYKNLLNEALETYTKICGDFSELVDLGYSKNELLKIINDSIEEGNAVNVMQLDAAKLIDVDLDTQQVLRFITLAEKTDINNKPFLIRCLHKFIIFSANRKNDKEADQITQKGLELLFAKKALETTYFNQLRWDNQDLSLFKKEFFWENLISALFEGKLDQNQILWLTPAIKEYATPEQIIRLKNLIENFDYDLENLEFGNLLKNVKMYELNISNFKTDIRNILEIETVWENS